MAEGGYSTLTEAETWSYHAYDYAWRRVILNLPLDKSPADRTGEWFDKALVEDAVVMLLQRHRWGRRSREEPAPFREAAQQREAFARASGYADFEHMMRVGIQRARMPGEAGSGSKSLNQALVEAGLQPMAPAEELLP